MNKAMTKKLMVLGMDAMDPRLTRKFVDMGIMPNTKKMMDMGSCREDLVLLGGQPTVTPPMWTTLSTGAYPRTHGITCFFRQDPEHLERTGYNLDSRKCTAEQFWNVAVEAGLKTLVYHWPGSSWPPTSDSPLLHVVDGTQPPMINAGIGVKEKNFMLQAREDIPSVTFKRSASANGITPCVINDMKLEDDDKPGDTYTKALSIDAESAATIVLDYKDGELGADMALVDMALSPIKEAHGWVDAPTDAKEFTMLLSGGLLRRPCLILKNEEGIYDKIAIYKSKKDAEAIAVLDNDVYTVGIIDECIAGDERFDVTRNMRVLRLAEDGSSLIMWIGGAMRLDADELWHPKSLYKAVVENVGYPMAQHASLGSQSSEIIKKVILPTWEAYGKWQSESNQYLIEKEGYDVVFSHYHFIDIMGHVFFKHLNGTDNISKDEFEEILETVYRMADDYIGSFMHYLDEDWTILVVSDHAQVCPEHKPPLFGDLSGVNCGVMIDLGYMTMVKDENGNDTKEIDWSKTKAIASRGNHVYINLKGRWEHGIVDPEDQYELENQIMTDMAGYRDKKTGMRVFSCVLRNRDAVLLGMGGPECGDILAWTAEGYNYDHCDSLSTTLGTCGTSVSPIFFAAGPGIKKGYRTDRYIEQVDVAPTCSALLGLRMTAQCEGAPMYQILDEVY